MIDDPLDALQALIISRKGSPANSSYTAQLFKDGRKRIAQKLGEEATETVIAAVSGDLGEVVSEAADLVYHLMVLLADAGLSIDNVRTELARRTGTSGLTEKANRSS